MKKIFMQKLMVAVILTVAAVSPSWADYTITKSNGDPAVEGTDYAFSSNVYDVYIELLTNDLVLSGEIDIPVLTKIADCKFTLKDVTITSNHIQGALLLMNTPINLVLEGTNRLVSTSSTGPAIRVYNSGKDVTFTGSGELYMTSHAYDYDNYHSCLFFMKMTSLGKEYTQTATAEDFTIKGSTEYNADMSTLADAAVASYQYEYENHDYHVCDIMIGDAVCNTVWMKGPEATPDKNYLCFTANEDGSTVELIKNGTIITTVIEYSTDGTSWTAVDFSSNTTTGTITLANAGDKVYFRNAKPASEGNYFSMDSSNYFQFIMAGSIAASGNIMSLVDLNCQATTISQQCTFYKLFFNCTKLTSAPELPATTLKTSCYYQMFYQCGLTSAPELPATTLATNCYYGMFYYCKYLTTAPELPATTLATSCYYNMFKNCSSLNDMKVALPKFSNTTGWVSTVASAGTFSCPEGLTGTGQSKIPTGWTVKNTYDLAITSETGWASMCVNLPLQVPEGAEVYYASAVDGTTIELTQIAAGTVMAPRTAVIVKGTGTVGFPIVSAAGTSYTDNLFQGSSAPKACNASENYVLNASKSSDDNVHFSIYTGTTLSGHKAWLPMSAVSGASSIQFRFADATAISTVETEVAEDVIYNLAGQRVGSDYRGLVIKNGKKVFNN